ncbi:3hydroxyacyl-CoA dehydrogenase, NAD binding domain containing protein [Acanthamoeba castellanii str. Neff]|uniref:3hydroxyacyl-CoA dehydrogenase, NAD binding domain containing protein n=1 Tax=Acanthamoeba castellanii (strain ATCC 30010 / Neff) TaxID=1257118 RepID=L8GVC3_ACACF|nr:3hydroxyacyl-CoA dehydrogenase, NAD binding domain containing protein [Acanthamoeba castellanii str. Neff]ELR16970.1 3hydroxyacyl-CoA dehydrogenase, NAD binding domain containing protein [Acanthamoeba castellanii str. Neff]
MDDTKRTCRRRREVILNHLGLGLLSTALTKEEVAAPLDAGLAAVQFGAESVSLHVHRDGSGVAVLTIDNPPVNALSRGVFDGLIRLTHEALEDDNVKLLVITGANQKFVAGAEIASIQDSIELLRNTPDRLDADSMRLMEREHAWLNWLESQSKPVVAAMDTFALGGGLEVAMACHARVATRRTKLGLPELALGVIPGLGGTQRLPRLVGMKKAVDMMLSSRSLKADEAKNLGLVDEVVGGSDPAQLIDAAITVGKEIAEGMRPFVRATQLTDRLEPLPEAKKIIDERAYPPNTVVHPFACLDAVQAGVQMGGSSGVDAERRAVVACLYNDASEAMTHAFFAERKTANVSGVTDQGLQPRPIRSVGIIGGGLMGSGIATALLFSGIAVVIKEVSRQLLDAVVNTVTANLDRAVERRRLTREQRDRLLSMVTPTLQFADFVAVDMVIEAVVENLKVKQDVFREVEKVVKPDCILATNTSTIPIDQIATATQSAHRMLGVHFFSHASGGDRADARGVGAGDRGHARTGQSPAQDAHRRGQLPWITVNRIFFPFFQAASLLVDCGVDPYRIDR